MGGAEAHLVSALADTRLVASLWVALLGTGSHVRPQRCSVDTTETVDKRERRGETDRQTAVSYTHLTLPTSVYV